jgi:inosine-uridine nucleoside N-ribohydrolase
MGITRRKIQLKHKVIIDCDNTFGVSGRPIDDGQTIIYLLGRDDIEIVGICTTFGNSTIKDVYPATLWLMEQLGRKDIPVLKGASDYNEGDTEASRFLNNKSTEYPGEINLVAIGTMANLKTAQSDNPGFFGNLKQILTMGGYLHPLPYRGWAHVGEVNFAGDGLASWQVFRADCPVVIMNAHICFALPFGMNELKPIAEHDARAYFIMKELLLASAEHLEDAQDYLWDLLPALYISYPELFHPRTVKISSSPEEIEDGYLRLGYKGAEVQMPDFITDIKRCYEIMYHAWAKACMKQDGPWYDEWRSNHGGEL